MAVENIITDLFNELTLVITNQISPSVTAITSAIAPVMGSALLVYVIFIAYKIMYSNHEVIMSEVTKNVMCLALVSAFTVSTPYYMQYVVPFVTGAGDQLSAAITGSPASASALDSMINNVKTCLDTMMDKMQFGITDDWGAAIKSLWAVILIYVGSFIFIFYAAAYLLVAKFMVGLLLSVGTIFICFAFYPTTRGYFTSWCGQCLNYILLNVLYTLAIGILNSFIVRKFKLSDLGVESSFQIIIVFFISMFIIQQISVLVSSLTGGMGINGLTSSVSSLAGGTASRLRGLAGVGKSAAQKLMNLFSNGIKGG
ncbi:TPA: type IV secretion system protein [Salmonella enterica]